MKRLITYYEPDYEYRCPRCWTVNQIVLHPRARSILAECRYCRYKYWLKPVVKEGSMGEHPRKPAAQ